MTTKRFMRSQQLTVKACERCNKSHSFPIEVIFDREVNAMGMMYPKLETHDIVLSCPTTGENIIISVPVSLNSLEALVQIRLGESKYDNPDQTADK